MNLPYFAADALGVTLYQVGQKLVANETRQLGFGSWRLEAQIEVESDILGATEFGFWVTIAGKLRLYVIIRQKESLMFALDSSRLTEVEARTRFEAKTVNDRMSELKPAIKTIFRWKEQGVGWERLGNGVNFA